MKYIIIFILLNSILNSFAQAAIRESLSIIPKHVHSVCNRSCINISKAKMTTFRFSSKNVIKHEKTLEEIKYKFISNCNTDIEKIDKDLAYIGRLISDQIHDDKSTLSIRSDFFGFTDMWIQKFQSLELSAAELKQMEEPIKGFLDFIVSIEEEKIKTDERPYSNFIQKLYQLKCDTHPQN